MRSSASKRLSASEVIEEVDWFFAAGISPEITAAELGRSLWAIAQVAYTSGRRDLGNIFSSAHLVKKNGYLR